MNGRKMARIKRCLICGYRIEQHERHAGPHGYSRFCTGGDGDPIELHDAYMEGPDSNCPQGFWSGLDPVGPTDPQEWETWNKKRARENIRNTRKPDITRTVRHIDESKDIQASAETALAVLVAAGKVPAWLADEIANELGATT